MILLFGKNFAAKIFLLVGVSEIPIVKSCFRIREGNVSQVMVGKNQITSDTAVLFHPRAFLRPPRCISEQVLAYSTVPSLLVQLFPSRKSFRGHPVFSQSSQTLQDIPQRYFHYANSLKLRLNGNLLPNFLPCSSSFQSPE